MDIFTESYDELGEQFYFDGHVYFDDNGVITDCNDYVIGSVVESFCGEYWLAGKGADIFQNIHKNENNAYENARSIVIINNRGF